ncbi:MAG: efflux RND transporter periplasmic adaptor subunit [Planctomycetota bacterium]
MHMFSDPDKLPCQHKLSVVACWLAIVMTGCDQSRLSEGDVAVTDTPSSSTAPRPAVRTVAVLQQEMRKTTAQPATVHPLFEAKLKARVGGYIESLQADIGDVVEAGDVLATISVPEMEKRRAVVAARVNRNRALELQSESGVALAQANVKSAEARLEQSKSELFRATASLKAAEAELERTSDLVARQSLQQRVLDEVTMRRDAETANLEAAKSAVVSTEADVVVAKAKESAAEADLQAAAAETEIAERELEEAEVMLAYSEIRAPFAGVITQRHVDPGDLVIPDDHSPANRPLFVIHQSDRVRVRIPVPEADAALVNPGDSIELTFPAFPKESLAAEVTRVSGSLDTDTRTMLIESEVDNPERKLVPGMFAMATITLATDADVAVLPARSIRFDESGKAFVYVLQEDETVSMVEVATGADEGNWIEVLSPLKPGQLVIDAHRGRFQDGQAVRVLPPE